MASKKKAVEAQLKTAVDWKIFEWQAMLVGADDDDVSEKAMGRCKTWLQPIHFNEVVKERAYDGRCGYPCCDERIAVPRVDFDSAEEKKYFRIDRNAGTVDEANGLDFEKLFYCAKRDEEGRPRCLNKSRVFVSTMDSSIPASRAAAMELDLSDRKQVGGSAADVLKALSLATDSAEAFKSKSPSKKDRGGGAVNRDNKEGAAGGDASTANANKIGEDAGADDKAEAEEAAERERKEKRRKEKESKKAAEGQPPLYTHGDMTTRGALKPAKWSVKNSGAPLATSAAAEPKSEPDTVTRAKLMLQSLRDDPTLRNIHGTPPPKGSLVSKGKYGGSTPGTVTDASGKGASSWEEAEGAKHASAKGEGDRDKTAVAKDDEFAVDKEERGHDDGDDAVYAPPSAAAPAPGGGSNSDDLAQARQKALEKATQQKNAILAMKEKYRRSMTGMDVMGGQVLAEEVMQQPQSPQAPAKVSSPAGKTPSPSKQEQEQEQESPWGLQKLSPSPEKTQGQGQGAPQGMMNAEGFLDFSWREERLDTSIQQALPHGKAQELLAAESKKDKEKEAAAASPAAPPRARLNPRGARARELARKAAAKEETGSSGPTAVTNVVVERGAIAGAAAVDSFMTRKVVEVAADASREEEGGVAPVAEYDVGLQAGKAREVDWREPDEALLATLKTVPERITKPQATPGIDPEQRKESLFKQRRRQYADMSAAASGAYNQLTDARAQAQTRGVHTAGMALSQAKIEDGPYSSSQEGKKASAGAKTVSWDIQEVHQPTMLPEESIADKYDSRDPDASPEPKDYESALPPSSSSPGDRDRDRDRGAMFEEHPSEAPVRINHELRNEFFSREGVSLTFLPKGTDLKLEDVEGSGRRRGRGAAEAKQVSGRIDVVAEAEAKTREKERREVEEAEAEENKESSSDESPWSDSEDSEAEEDDADGELLYDPAAGGGVSFFLQVYTLLDDMLSHTGPVLKKKPFPGATQTQPAAEGEGEGEGEDEAADKQPPEEAAPETDAKDSGGNDGEAKKQEKVAGRPLSLPPRRRPAAAAGGNKPEETALSFLARGVTSAEEAVQLSTVLRGPVLSEYHQCKRRLLEVADAQAPVPALTSTGWTVVGLLCIDAIVRLRRLLFRQQDSQQDSTDGRTTDMWSDVVSECLGRLQHNKAARVRCDKDELQHLKAFFDNLR